jgi:protein TonB
VIISTIQQNGIAFEPTPQALEKFRKAGADNTVLAALREAWHADVPKPLGDREILMLVAGDAPSENIVRIVQERGIDFQPTNEYLEGLRLQGAKDVLIAALRTSAVRPFSKYELVQQLRTHADQAWVAQKLQLRAIDFEPDTKTLQSLRNAGARMPLLEAVRTAKRVKPFVAQTPPPPPGSPPLVAGKAATLICEASDADVPVFAGPNDLGNIVARLRCGERVTFLERVVSPPGIDRVQYGDGKEGFVSNSYLEIPVTTTVNGVTAPSKVYCPDPPYTPEARRDGIEGTVTLMISVDTQGNVSDVRQTSGLLGEGLDQSAIDTVKTWRFAPAKRDGVPVAVRVMVQISFRLYHDTP